MIIYVWWECAYPFCNDMYDTYIHTQTHHDSIQQWFGGHHDDDDADDYLSVSWSVVKCAKKVITLKWKSILTVCVFILVKVLSKWW